MNKRDFLKATGVLGIASILPVGKLMAESGPGQSASPAGSCVLIPSETAGPFPLDLTANSYYFRQDITEDREGAPFTVKMKIIGLDNCLPMQNVRVNIWHCDKDGKYSGYDNQMNPGQAGLTYLRGYQITDANGEVSFKTIFPGWYSGRICHIHFQVYVSTNYAAISQMTYDINTKNAIYAANSSVYTKGADPMTLASDNIFSDGYTYQLASLTGNNTDGYECYLEVTVQGTGVATGNTEKETDKVVSLGQNYPNPYTDETTIPFYLKQPGDASIHLFDLNGRMVAEITQPNLGIGQHNIKLNMQQLGLATGHYAYQLKVSTAAGSYVLSKMMTAAK